MMAKTIFMVNWSLIVKYYFPKQMCRSFIRPYKSREDYFSLELPPTQTSFTIRTDIFQTKTIDIRFCLISGDIQHSILWKVSYLFILKKQTKRLNKLKLACTQTLFSFSFRSFREHRRARTSAEREKHIKGFYCGIMHYVSMNLLLNIPVVER